MKVFGLDDLQDLTNLIGKIMGKPKKNNGLSREERLVSCIGDIIQELITCHNKGKDVDLNRLKTRMSAQHNLETSPRLVGK